MACPRVGKRIGRFSTFFARAVDAILRRESVSVLERRDLFQVATDQEWNSPQAFLDVATSRAVSLPAGTPHALRAGMDELVRAILLLGSPALATEEAACDALAALRFPNGVACACGAPCTRELALIRCARHHRFTLLVGTPFGTKRRPVIRALFLAIRAFATSTRSVSARELARDLSIPHVTLWRHLHTLRALLPPPAALPTTRAALVQVCGRRSSARPAFVRVGARLAVTRELGERGRPAGGNAERLMGEQVRAWIVATFKGVWPRWLSAYALEASTRWRVRELMADVLVERLLDGEALTFTQVRARFR